MSSKLSFVIAQQPDKLVERLLKARPRLVKFQGEYTSEMDVLELARHGIRVEYRPVIEGATYETIRPEDYYAAIPVKLRRLRDVGLILAPVNEPIVKTEEQAKTLNRWQVRFAELAHADGLQVGAFAWSTTHPTPDVLRKIVPHLVEAAAASDWHLFHEYATMAHGWTAALHYQAFEALLPPSARRGVIVDETGLDDNGDQDTGGWRGKLPPRAYLELLAAYDRALLTDPQVTCATIFEWRGDWSSFLVDEMIDLIVDYIEAAGGGVPIEWKPPEDPPPPPPPRPTDPIVKLSVDRTLVHAGVSVVVSWEIDGIQSARLNGLPIAGPTGSWVVTIVQPVRFELVAVLLDGSTITRIVNVDVQEEPPPPPPPSDECYVDPRATWIKVEQGTRYKVRAVYFYDAVPLNVPGSPPNLWESLDSTRTSVKVVDRYGAGIPFEIVVHEMPEERPAFLTDVDGVAWWDLFGGNSIDPAKGDGPDQVLIGDARVRNISLPLRHHVRYAIVVEKVSTSE